MPCKGSSLWMRTSNGARQSLVSKFFCHVFALLIPFTVQDYPATHFKTLIVPSQQPLPSIIINYLSLLARLTAHSSLSGHTPPTLSPLFGPLLFGLGPAALPFHITYLKYLHATNAMEHVLLAFVRRQDAPSNESCGSSGRPGSAASLGIPTHLKDWTRGHPAMLPDIEMMGFGGLESSKKKFHLDLMESAQTVRLGFFSVVLLVLTMRCRSLEQKNEQR